jgi:hypothetical protein
MQHEDLSKNKKTEVGVACIFNTQVGAASFNEDKKA